MELKQWMGRSLFGEREQKVKDEVKGQGEETELVKGVKKEKEIENKYREDGVRRIGKKIFQEVLVLKDEQKLYVL